MHIMLKIQIQKISVLAMSNLLASYKRLGKSENRDIKCVNCGVKNPVNYKGCIMYESSSGSETCPLPLVCQQQKIVLCK